MPPSRPVRSCIGCRTRRDVGALVRVTSDGEPAVDGSSAGRGVWLCRGPEGVDRECLERALRSGGFARGWRRRVDDGERDALRERLSSWAPEK